MIRDYKIIFKLPSEKVISFDIRVFDDALTFKIAMMVVSYMKYMEKND